MAKPDALVSSQIKPPIFLLALGIAAVSMIDRKVQTVNIYTIQAECSPLSVTSSPIGNKLSDLILDNFPQSNQLEKLLPTKDANHEKLVLQFYINADSKLTLAAYVGHGQRKNFSQQPQILKVRETSSTIDVSKNIVLTDQEISMNKNEIEKLRGIVNDNEYKYIIFRPRKDGNHIVFDLYYTTYLKKKPFTEFNLGITTNPSPPKDAN